MKCKKETIYGKTGKPIKTVPIPILKVQETVKINRLKSFITHRDIVQRLLIHSPHNIETTSVIQPQPTFPVPNTVFKPYEDLPSFQSSDQQQYVPQVHGNNNMEIKNEYDKDYFHGNQFFDPYQQFNSYDNSSVSPSLSSPSQPKTSSVGSPCNDYVLNGDFALNFENMVHSFPAPITEPLNDSVDHFLQYDFEEISPITTTIKNEANLNGLIDDVQHDRQMDMLRLYPDILATL